jgi:uncharacterized protein
VAGTVAGHAVLDVVDASAARRWAVTALAALGHAREEIDALNVYPVPDGDTGTNLYLTLEAACAAVLALPADSGVAEVARGFARGALLGARGNSGVITAQLFHGWADVLAERGVLDAGSLREAVARADAQAWAAVETPVEGTILSVSRESARAAGEAPAAASLGDLVGRCVGAAREALARTPDQLDVLRRAGVVDAGGRGLVVVLEALDDVVNGRRRPRDDPRGRRRPLLPPVRLPACSGDEGHPEHRGPSDPAYEVMYLLDAQARDVGALRTRLAALGDSLVVVGGGGLWHVHVHTDDPGAAVEAGVVAGRPHSVRITHFAEQTARREQSTLRQVATGLVACAAGPGLAQLFGDAGAVVVRTGDGRRPSTADLLAAVRRAGAQGVVVLPNDADTVPVARAAAAAAREEGIRVGVVPTRAQVQGLAAAAVHDASRPFDDDVAQMSAAAGAARDGAVTVAARDAMTLAGPCRTGDALGVVQGEFAVVGGDVSEVAVAVTERLLSQGGELVTIVVGEAGGEEAAQAVAAHLRTTRRDLEVSVLHGGQARYPLLLGVE